MARNAARSPTHRSRGRVRSLIDCGQQRYYRGSEVIAWIVEMGK